MKGVTPVIGRHTLIETGEYIHKKQEFESFHFRLLELRPIKGTGAKQVKLDAKSYYSNIPVSQEIFWIVAQRKRRKLTLVPPPHPSMG